jgi:hypothetical protein
MKLVIITSFPFPDGKATANRVKVFSEQLLKHGYISQSNIVCCSIKKNSVINHNENTRITNIYASVINKRRLVSRSIKELIISIKLWLNGRNTEAELMIVTIPSVLLLLSIIIFKKPRILVLDIRDAVWTYFPTGYLNSLLGMVLRSLVSIASKKADIVSVTNAYEAASVKNISGIEPIVVSNGISVEKLTECSGIAMRPLLVDKIRVAYIGNVGIAQELDVLIKFAKIYEGKVEIDIVGDGAMLQSLQESCHSENVKNIMFHGAVSPANVMTYAKKADVLFAQIGENFSTAVPTKVFEYVASGCRVLLGLPIGPARDIFNEFRGVEIYQVGKISCLKDSYERLIFQKYEETDRQYNLEILKNNYIREKNIEQFLSKLNGLLLDS